MSFCMYTVQGDFACNEERNKNTIEHFGAARWGYSSPSSSSSNVYVPREPTVSRWDATSNIKLDISL